MTTTKEKVMEILAAHPEDLKILKDAGYVYDTEEELQRDISNHLDGSALADLSEEELEELATFSGEVFASLVEEGCDDLAQELLNIITP